MAGLPTLPGKIIDAHNHLADHDPDGSKLIDIMDAHNVEMTLIMGTLGRRNGLIVEAVRKHPGRFIGGVYIDPRQGSAAIDEVRHYHGEGIHLVKLFPNFGYYPDEDRFRPLFDVVAELGMGVLSHCGWLTPSMGVSAAYYSRPGRFEKLIRTYPDTVFIFAHMGGMDGFLESRMLISRAPNAFADTAPGQGLWVLEDGGSIAASTPTDKIMWGADMYYDRRIIDKYLAAFGKQGFTEQLEKIFYSNARGVFEKIGALPPAS